MEKARYDIDRKDLNNRKVIANQDLERGCVIMKCSPLEVAVKGKLRSKVCSYCLHEKDQLSKCGECEVVYYCSGECQKKEWPIHKKECKVFKRIKSSKFEITSHFQLALRLYKRYEDESDEFRKKIDDLIVMVKDVDKETMSFFKDLALALLKYLEVEPTLTKIDFVVTLLCKYNQNMFSIPSLVTNESVAIALYNPANFLNHSCDYNAIATFEGRNQKITAVRSIQAGNEITISYVDASGTTKERQEYLKKQYFFDCACSLCTNQKLNAEKLTFKCPNCLRGSFALTNENCPGFPCPDCKNPIDPAQIQIQLSQMKSSLLEYITKKKNQEIVSTFEKMCQLLGPYNSMYDKIYPVLIDYWSTASNFTLALDLSIRHNKMIQKWLPCSDTIAGWKFLEIAQLAWGLQNAEVAKKYGEEAWALLKLFYSEETLKNLYDFIEEVNSYLRFKNS